jgi:hypothetical protein
MMSSLASVLVAKANATPEKVVPCKCCGQLVRALLPKATYKVNTNNELRLGAALSRYLCHGVGSVVHGGRTMGRWRTWRWCTVAVAIAGAWRALRRVSGGTSLGRVGRLLGRISRRGRVDGGKGTCWAAVG